MGRFLILFCSFLSISHSGSAHAKTLAAGAIAAGEHLLENQQVSYAMGGHKIRSKGDCEACTTCLKQHRQSQSKSFKNCPICRHCTMDCSHFVQLAYSLAGFHFPYLNTATMLSSSPAQLMARFGLKVVGSDSRLAIPGDLLVYKGHVMLLVANHGTGFGHVLHATGGREIRAAGQGIQRARHADIAHYKGPLLRILRPTPHLADTRLRKMRPVK